MKRFWPVCFLIIAGCDSSSLVLEMDAFTQDAFQCGPASLAAVYRYWGAASTDKAVAARIFNEEEQGTLPLMLVADARRSGYRVAFGHADNQKLLHALASGVPVIRLTRRRGADHFEVVHGFRGTEGRLRWLICDGRGRSRWVQAGSDPSRFSIFVWRPDHTFKPPPMKP